MKRQIQIAILGEAQRGKFIPVATPCEVTLDCESFTIGSGDGNCLRIDDPTVSRLHLAVEFEDGEWTINDTGSNNGTVVFDGDTNLAEADWQDNGRRVSTFQLNGKQIVLIGRVALLFTARPPRQHVVSPVAQAQTA